MERKERKGRKEGRGEREEALLFPPFPARIIGLMYALYIILYRDSCKYIVLMKPSITHARTRKPDLHYVYAALAEVERRVGRVETGLYI